LFDPQGAGGEAFADRAEFIALLDARCAEARRLESCVRIAQPILVGIVECCRLSSSTKLSESAPSAKTISCGSNSRWMKDQKRSGDSNEGTTGGRER